MKRSMHQCKQVFDLLTCRVRYNPYVVAQRWGLRLFQIQIHKQRCVQIHIQKLYQNKNTWKSVYICMKILVKGLHSTAHTRMQASLWFFTWRGTIHLLWHRGERSDCSRCHLCNWWLPIRKQKHPHWFCKYKYNYKYRVKITMTADPKMVAWCWFINQEQDRKCGIVVCDAVLCEWR